MLSYNETEEKTHNVSENLLDFFNLVLTGKGETELSKKIENEVEKVRTHEEWRLEYMTLYMRDEEKKDEGRISERIEAIQRMLKKEYSKDDILDLGYSENEIAQAEQSLFTTV